ncbi:hypothetical protein BD289DRAFT_486177 [Coniella lustricola]|uniref:Uncharacterized protein n=1 Tax=Coniella lustricola TaxID=2025994 RepID=A0A2T2ZW31_9PEZI|nr:hypothetical protein BD289DRAFT_486177 [Coniella lustricola]
MASRKTKTCATPRQSGHPTTTDDVTVNSLVIFSTTFSLTESAPAPTSTTKPTHLRLLPLLPLCFMTRLELNVSTFSTATSNHGPWTEDSSLGSEEDDELHTASPQPEVRHGQWLGLLGLLRLLRLSRLSFPPPLPQPRQGVADQLVDASSSSDLVAHFHHRRGLLFKNPITGRLPTATSPLLHGTNQRQDGA